MEFNHYFSNDELTQIIKHWSDAYPKLIQVSVIGNSHEERPIRLLTLTNQATGADRDKSAIWIDADPEV